MWDVVEIRRGNLLLRISTHLVEQARRSVKGMSAEDRQRALNVANLRLDRITDPKALTNSHAMDLVLWHVLQETL